MSGGGAEREREREWMNEWMNESEAGSRLRAVGVEPDVGLEPTNHEIMTWAEVGHLINWSTQAPQVVLSSEFRAETGEKMCVHEAYDEDVQWAVEHTGMTWKAPEITCFWDPNEIMRDPSQHQGHCPPGLCDSW